MVEGKNVSMSKLSPKDSQIWGRVARSVKPLEISELKAEPVATEAPAVPKKESRIKVNVRVKKPEVRRPVAILNRESERQIRLGDVQIDATCDLHYFNGDLAHSIMKRFVIRKRQEGCRSVLIITGKGHGGEGLIRRSFRLWLETEEARSLITGFSPAHYKHGGAGAFYLFLRKSKK